LRLNNLILSIKHVSSISHPRNINDKSKHQKYEYDNLYLSRVTTNQHSMFATSMNPDQPAQPRSLIRIHAIRLPTLLQVGKLIANSMDPDQTARRRRLVWIHAGRKRTMLVLSWRGSFIFLIHLQAICFGYNVFKSWIIIVSI
jgi:hypothetical protein